MSIVTVSWTDSIQYQFSGTPKKHYADFALKRVYMGHFVDRAPEGLQCGVTYCLKYIQAAPERRAARNREYFDLVDFKGSHLRQILARNPNAEACSNELRLTGTCKARDNCWVVEPAYRPADELFSRCRDYSVAQRLDIVLQYALGCSELTQERNRLGGLSIQTHRDLKNANGVIDDREDGIRIRLIDFASIRLNKEDLLTPQQIRTASSLNDTYDSAMSPSNTPPEVLPNSFGRISGRTDVYALGMLLASLFLHDDNNKYFNPNLEWVNNHGWDTRGGQVESEQLVAGFRRCKELYEPAATWKNTWIEADLNADGKRCLWESMADKKVLASIRKLFFHSTRIDPKDRLSLPSFIQNLQQIIKTERTSPAKIPVSIYLFDLTDFDRFRSDYQSVAALVLEKEQQIRSISSQAMCIAYRRALPSDRSPMDAVTVLSEGLVSNSQALRSILADCSRMNGTGISMVAHALMRASAILYQKVTMPDSRYIFSGHIHLFTPQIPALASIAPITMSSGPLDLLDFCNYLNRIFEKVVPRIALYTPDQPDPASEDGTWFTYIPLRSKTGGSPMSGPAPDPDQPQTPEYQADRFYDGTHDYYIELDNGEIAYIGLK